MALVKFTDDHADYRILDGNDLRRHADVTGFHKTEFVEGVETEVSDDVAQALVGNPELFGKFEYVEAAEETKAVKEPEAKGSNGPKVDAQSDTGEETPKSIKASKG